MAVFIISLAFIGCGGGGGDGDKDTSDNPISGDTSLDGTTDNGSNLDDDNSDGTTSRTGRIPDTGQTTSYTETFGEDADYAINPQSYTKLNSNGKDLPDSATEWAMIRDNVTGLIWENKTDGDGIHDKDNTYTWYDPNPETNGGNAGTHGDRTDTHDFVTELNKAHFGGFDDWRLPTATELCLIATIEKSDPSSLQINTAYFQHTANGAYWSSTTYAGSPDIAWYSYFGGDAGDYDGHKASSMYARAVRGGKHNNGFVDNGDGTITDTATGLMWQKNEAGSMSWEEAITYCENLTLPEGGYDDWRLPNCKELQTIVNYSRIEPAINQTVFSAAVSSDYWSSTTSTNFMSNAYSVSFGYGVGYEGFNKSYSLYVRAVRNVN